MIKRDQIIQNTRNLLLQGVADPKKVLERLEVKKKFYEQKVKESPQEIWKRALFEVNIEIETVQDYINNKP